MTWTALFHADFVPEFDDLSESVRVETLALVALLKQYGPTLGRPQVDTLNGSKHANMKELRFNADNGVWRVAFAFDPARQAILLTAGDKSGGSESLFYRRLIRKADKRFDQHIIQVKERQGAQSPKRKSIKGKRT